MTNRVRGKMLPFLLGLMALLGVPAAAQGPAALTVYYYRDGQAVAVERPPALRATPPSGAEAALRALLAGPTAGERRAGLESALPAGAELAAVAVDGEAVTVDLALPLPFLRGELEAVRSDAIVEQIVKTLHPLGLHGIQVRARDEGGAWLPLSSFLERPEVPTPALPENDEPLPGRTAPSVATSGQPPITGQGQPQGALTGKTVWLSAGHGWYWSTTLGRWTTQRGNNYGLVEDLSNAEAVNYYLARYLWNAGADVWLVRERAMVEAEVIVDNDAGSPLYSETGSWLTSTTPGYNGSTYRWASTYSSQTSTATWRPDLPRAGWYAVWAWFLHGANRPFDARYQVRHAGGVTTVRISQEVHGLTWRYLGEYYFEAGTAGAVTLVNASDETAQAVVADAVRFGGGLGSAVEPGGTSGRPRWEEQSTYWATYQGAPPEVVAEEQGRILDEFVRRELLVQRAGELGYRVSDKELAEALARIPALQVDGVFSRDRYAALLRAQGRSEAEFEAEFRRDLEISQLRNALALSAFALPAEVRRRVELTGEVRDVDLLIVPAERFLAGVTVTPGQVEAWYRDHEADYRSAESVALQYVRLCVAASCG